MGIVRTTDGQPVHVVRNFRPTWRVPTAPPKSHVGTVRMNPAPATLTAVQHILLVDDEDDCNFVTKLVLKKAGFTGKLTCFTSAVEALVHMRGDGEKPDIMFVDINMPAVNGFEFLTTCEAEGFCRTAAPPWSCSPPATGPPIWPKPSPTAP